jgi:hypothetical protein
MRQGRYLLTRAVISTDDVTPDSVSCQPELLRRYTPKLRSLILLTSITLHVEAGRIGGIDARLEVRQPYINHSFILL